MKRKLSAGLTSVTLPLFIQDSSIATGAGLGSLVYNTSGLGAEYRRQGQSSWTTITLVSATLGTFTSGGFIADGSLAGAYELGLPDAAAASGARWVAVRLYGAANMVPCLIEIELDVVNYQDGAGFGLSRLDAAVTSRSTLTAQLVWDFLTAGATTANSIGKRIADFLNATVTLAASQPNYAPAKAGDAMSLTTAERTATANEVEAQIIDDTDSEKVLAAITDKIAAVNPSLAGLTLAAIASAVRDAALAGASANSLGAAITSILATSSTAATQSTAAASSAATASTQASAAAASATSADTKASAIITAVGSPLQAGSYTAPPSASANASAVRTELATELARIVPAPRIVRAADIAVGATNALRFRLPATGLTIVDVKLRKFNGSYSESLTRDLTPIGNGEYDLVAIAGDRDTEGENRWMLTMSDGSVWVVVEMVQGDALAAIASASAAATLAAVLPYLLQLIRQRKNGLRRVGGKLYATFFDSGKTPYLIMVDGANAASTSGASVPFLLTDQDRPTFARPMTEVVQGSGVWESSLDDLDYANWLALLYSRNNNDLPKIADNLEGADVAQWNGSSDSGTGNLTATTPNTATSTARPGVTVTVTSPDLSFSTEATSNNAGVASFSLRDGTYTVTSDALGFRGQSKTVVIPTMTTVDVGVTPIAVPASPEAGTITGWVECLDKFDQPTAGIPIWIQMVEAPIGTAGRKYDFDPHDHLSSDGTAVYEPTGDAVPLGRVYFPHVVGASYLAWTIDAEGRATPPKPYMAIAEDLNTSFPLPEGLGEAWCSRKTATT